MDRVWEHHIQENIFDGKDSDESLTNLKPEVDQVPVVIFTCPDAV